MICVHTHFGMMAGYVNSVKCKSQHDSENTLDKDFQVKLPHVINMLNVCPFNNNYTIKNVATIT